MRGSRLRGGALWPQFVLGAASATAVWLLFVRRVNPVDLEVFLRAGHAVSRGLSPYVSASSPAVYSGHAFVYPYLTAWVFAPLSALHLDVAEALYYLSSVLALACCVRLLAGRRPGPAVVVLVFAAEPVVRAMQLGTVNVWLLLGLALAWRWRDRRAVVVAALVGLVVAKLFLAPMVVWLLITGRRRSVYWTAALAAAAIVLGCVLAHISVPSFVHMLGALSAHEAAQSSSLTSRLIGLGAGRMLAGALSAVLAAGIVLAGWWRHRRTGDERIVFCASVLASLVLSPIVWSHYWMLLLVVPLVYRWGARAAVSTLLITWLVSAPIGVPALQAIRAESGVGAALAGCAVLIAIAVAIPSILRRSPALRDSLAHAVQLLRGK